MIVLLPLSNTSIRKLLNVNIGREEGGNNDDFRLVITNFSIFINLKLMNSDGLLVIGSLAVAMRLYVHHSMALYETSTGMVGLACGRTSPS